MKEVDCFSLEQHQGPYEKWPLRTRLFVNGEASNVKVPGYVLLHQLQTDFGYLLVTDCDCPFEETTNFILLDPKSLKIVSCRQCFAPYGSYNLQSFKSIDGNSAMITFYNDDDWLLSVYPRGIPFFKPRLRLTRPRLLPGDTNA